MANGDWQCRRPDNTFARCSHVDHLSARGKWSGRQNVGKTVKPVLVSFPVPGRCPKGFWMCQAGKCQREEMPCKPNDGSPDISCPPGFEYIIFQAKCWETKILDKVKAKECAKIPDHYYCTFNKECQQKEVPCSGQCFGVFAYCSILNKCLEPGERCQISTSTTTTSSSTISSSRTSSLRDST